MIEADVVRTQWRHSWEFYVPSSELLAAAREQERLSVERGAYWEERLKEAKRDAEAKGIRVTDYREGLKTSNSTYAPAPSVQIDQTYVVRIQHAWQRVQYHADRVREFRRWASALARDEQTGGMARQVTAADMAYFWPDPDPLDADPGPVVGP